MDLTYSPQHETFRTDVRAFIAGNRHLAPDMFKLSRRAEPVLAWQRLLLEHGYAGRTVPRQYGGFGAKPDLLEARIIVDEFTAAGVPMGLGGASIAMFVPTLLAFGTEEQKATWIAPTIRGEVLWCQGYSEPEAGSDLASLKTSAVEDGDDFVINGQKIWTSYAHEADMMFALVRTERDRPKHDGISYLIFPMATPGIEVRPLRTMTGRPHFNEVFLTDVRVPKSQIVGARGEGWKVANYTLQHERGMLSDSSQQALRINELIVMLGEERIDGSRLADDPLWCDRLMRLQGRALALQFNELRLLTAAAKGENAGLARLVSKLQGCELNHQLAALALDMLGEIGTVYGDDPYQRAEGLWQYRYMFDLGLIIGGGTAQIQKNIIAERGLGLPREARPDGPRQPT